MVRSPSHLATASVGRDPEQVAAALATIAAHEVRLIDRYQPRFNSQVKRWSDSRGAVSGRWSPTWHAL